VNFWSPENLRAVAGGAWLARPGDGTIGGAGIDSRTIRPGQVFFAMPGERTDGRAFLAAVRAAGSPLAMVESDGPVPDGMGVLRVASVRVSLVRLAAAYRGHCARLRVVAVTGSCGKTTTVRLIDAVLRGRLRGSASPKSYNNDIGVPLTLLNVAPGDQYVVCEVGTSGPGEIERLARVCDPDIAVITSIGRAHLAGLGSVEGIACEKAQLVNQMREGGLGVIPSDAPALTPFLRGVPEDRLIRIGQGPDADVRVTDVESGIDGTAFALNGRERYRIGLLGAHNAHNAACAAVVGRRLGVPEEEIAAGLAAARGPEMRLEARRVGPITIINDAYNANPESMAAALRTLAGLAGGRRVAIIGDMLELGAQSEDEHEALGRWIERERPAALVVAVGPRASRMAAGADERFASLDEASADRIAGLVEPGDIVLVKGSRGVALERVAGALEARFAPAVREVGSR
jgi:UDP-N-acetylmuramoyl-tripeptide--D-alanyl-D-alanine ligase